MAKNIQVGDDVHAWLKERADKEGRTITRIAERALAVERARFTDGGHWQWDSGVDQHTINHDWYADGSTRKSL